MEKSREQFEVEFSKQFPAPLTEIDVFIKEVALKFWQASRESLEIELPDASGAFHTDYDYGYRYGVFGCEEGLNSTGVKAK